MLRGHDSSHRHSILILRRFGVLAFAVFTAMIITAVEPVFETAPFVRTARVYAEQAIEPEKADTQATKPYECQLVP